MARTGFKSDRHVALSRAFPPELTPKGFAMTGPHRKQRALRGRRYLALVAIACAYAAYNYLTT